MKCNNYSIYCDEEKKTCKGCFYERRKEKMYEVTFTIDGIMHKATLPRKRCYRNNTNVN